MLKQIITEKEILVNIGDYEIFRKYFGDFDVGKSYNSKIRNDRHPSVGFFEGDNGRLIYNDFASNDSFTSINYVAHIFNLSYKQAINKIAKDFNINKTNIKSVATTVINGRTPIKKIPKKVRILVKDWDEEALAFWGTFGISEEELVGNNIYNVKKAFINDWEVPDKGYLRFGFYLKDFEGKEYIKVYCPDTPEKENKWISSCPMKAVFNYNALPYKSDTLVITKSVKEMLIMKKLFTDVISIQAENKGAISNELLSVIEDKYKKVLYFGDNDEQGIKIGNLFNEKYNFKFIHFPLHFKPKFNIKDIADFVKKWGIDYYKKYLNVLEI